MSSARGRRSGSDSRSVRSRRPSATPHSRPQTTRRISSMRTLQTRRFASGANDAARSNSPYALTQPSKICPRTPTTASAVPTASMAAAVSGSLAPCTHPLAACYLGRPCAEVGGSMGTQA